MHGPFAAIPALHLSVARPLATRFSSGPASARAYAYCMSSPALPWSILAVPPAGLHPFHALLYMCLAAQAPSPSNDGDVQERTDGDQAKHTAATTVSPAARASPDIPVSTSAENELADDHHLAADVAFTAAPTAAAAAPPVKATAKSSAAAAAIAAKKSKTSSSKRKSKASTTTSGEIHGMGYANNLMQVTICTANGRQADC